MSNKDYHDQDAISKSGLDLIDKSPAHYQWAQIYPRAETASMKKGSLIHTLILEPEKFVKEYIILPDSAPKRPSVTQLNAKKPSEATLKSIHWWDQFNKESEGKIILSIKEYEDACRIQEAVVNNPVAMNILETAMGFEQSIFAEEFSTGVECKCRPDIIMENALYDLKTTKNANARSFSYSVRSYRYHVQAAFYLDTCNIVGMDVNQFGFIAVDTIDMPYQCTVFHSLSKDALQAGREEYMRNLKVYAECLETGEWPGYPESYDVIELAGYAYDEEEVPLSADFIEEY